MLIRCLGTAVALLSFVAGARGVQDEAVCHVDPYTNDWLAAQLTHRLDRALKAVEAAHARIKEDYGEWYDRLFDVTLKRWGGDDREDVQAWLTPTAAQRLKRRMMRAMAKQERFVISVGGHSACVGHGNFWEESYGHRLADFLCPIFGEMGVELVLRDHGMGAQGGCPSCVNMANTYGPDADVLFWDFGMTDHTEETRDLYVRQALLLPKQPVVLMSYNLKNERRGFLDHMKVLNNAGFGVGGYACQRIYELAPEGRLPDPSLAPEDIPFWLLGLQEYPKHQDTVPGSERYNQSVAVSCGEMGKKSGAAKWHPGFKEHRLYGLILGKLLLDVLEDALDEYNNWVIQNGDEELEEEDLTYIPAGKSDEAALEKASRIPLPDGGCIDLPWCNYPIQGRGCQAPHALPSERWDIGSLALGASELPEQAMKYAGNMVEKDSDSARCGFDVVPYDTSSGHYASYPPEASCTHHLDNPGYVPIGAQWLVLKLPPMTRLEKEGFVEDFRMDDADPVVKAYLDEPIAKFGTPVVVLCKAKEFMDKAEVELNGVPVTLTHVLGDVCAKLEYSEEAREKIMSYPDLVVAIRQRSGADRLRLTTVSWLT